MSKITQKGNIDPCSYWRDRSPRLVMGKGMPGSKRTLRNTASNASKNFLVTPCLTITVPYTLLTKVSQSQTPSKQLQVFCNSGRITGNYWPRFCYPRACDGCSNFLGLIYMFQSTICQQHMWVRKPERKLEGMHMTITSQESELKLYT